MACHTVVLPLLLLFLPFLLPATSADVAPGPSPTPAVAPELNLTSILENGGQYTTLLRLLNATRTTEQITSQLKNSYDGLTFFAPNDNAFTKLKPGTLNALTDQEQIQLLLYHVLPRYYSLAAFQTASNPLRTEASGPGGMYSVNVSTSTTSPLVNVSTGVADDVPIGSTLFARFPLAVYSIDNVLQPQQMFGSSHKASAPAPGQAAGKAAAGQKGVPKSDVAAEPPSEAMGEPEGGSTNAAAGRGTAVWMTTVIVLGGMSFLNLRTSS